MNTKALKLARLIRKHAFNAGFYWDLDRKKSKRSERHVERLIDLLHKVTYTFERPALCIQQGARSGRIPPQPEIVNEN